MNDHANGRDPIRPGIRRALDLHAPARTAGAAFVAALVLSGCGAAIQESEAPADRPADGPRVVQAGAPGEGSREMAPGEVGSFRNLPHTEADVRFMQHMIQHHRQAILMSDLVPDRTDNPDIRLMARRIDRSQEDEIAVMASWLEERDEPIPPAPAVPAEDPSMPGMLSASQLEDLSDARGEEFDRLFLQHMTFHHLGALEMVETLFASPGAGQESAIFNIASHIDSDQRIEIGRMQQMLRAMADG